MWQLFSAIIIYLHPIVLQNMALLSEEQLVRCAIRSEGISRHRHKPRLPVSILSMAIPLTVAWELVRLHLVNHLRNRRHPPYSKPWKPVSGDGKSHSTNFCNRSIIMQTAVTTQLKSILSCSYIICVNGVFTRWGSVRAIINTCNIAQARLRRKRCSGAVSALK